MRIHIRKDRPATWAIRRNETKHSWILPFVAIECMWEWIAYALSNWSFLEVLDYLETFSVLVVVIFYFSESGDRVKQRHYQASQVVNTSQGKGGKPGCWGQTFLRRTCATAGFLRLTSPMQTYSGPTFKEAICRKFRLTERIWTNAILPGRT